MTEIVPQKKHPISDVQLPEDRQKLLELANSTNQNIVVRERTISWVIVTGILSSVSILLDIFVFKDPDSSIFLKVFVSFMVLIFVYLLFNIIKSRKVPLLTIKPEGLDTSVFTTPVPWDAILDFSDRASFIHKGLNMGAALIFNLDENRIPEKNKKPRFQSVYYKKNQMYGDNVLVINGCGILNSNCDIVLAQIAAYRMAALARKKLQEMQ